MSFSKLLREISLELILWWIEPYERWITALRVGLSILWAIQRDGEHYNLKDFE